MPFSPAVTLFEPVGSRPVMQGGDHAIAALEDGFVVAWLENRGTETGVRAVLVEGDGRVETLELDALPGSTPVTNVAVAARGDVIEIYSVTNERALLRTTVTDGVVGDPTPLDIIVDQRVPLSIRARETHTEVIVSLGGPTVLVVSPDGAVQDRQLLTDADPRWVWGADREGDRRLVAWADRTPGGADDVFVSWQGGPPQLLATSENILLSHFGRPVMVQRGVGLIATSWLDESRVYRVTDEGMESIDLGPEDPDRPVFVADEPYGILVLSAGGPRGAGNGNTRISVREVSAAGDVEPRQVLAELPTSCQLERYDGARNATQDMVTWVESCGARVLRARTRPRCAR